MMKFLKFCSCPSVYGKKKWKTMIELNKIRTMKTLEAMQKPLKEFITFDKPTMLSVYAEDFGWGDEDYEADLEKATYMLEQVERRMKSLGHHLSMP